ncbi:MAG TPA: GAF domain-containing protein [Thermoflexia bacterium]|nr:GAF domain-containing protein [Thermoflexia bacterium]
MNWTFSPYVIILLIAFGVAVAVTSSIWRRRSAAGGAPFLGLLAAVAWWSLLYGLELASNDPWLMRLLIKFEYWGITATAVCWFLFVLRYTGRLSSIHPRLILQLSIIPAITILAAFTNEWHALVWSEISVLESAGMQTLKVAHGALFFVNVVYSYLLLGYSSLVMLPFIWRSRAVYRQQARLLFWGMILPWVGNAIYLLQLGDFPNVDLTPIFFSISVVLLAWGAFRFQLLDLVPVARHVVVESMGDMVIVLDLQRRVVDANPAATAILGIPVAEMLGQTLAVLLPEQYAVIMRYQDLLEAHAELPLQLGGERRVYDLRLSPLYTARKQLSGRLLVLRDITARKQIETSLAEQNKRFEQLLTVARVITEHPTLDATLQNVLNIAVSLTTSTVGSIFLLDAQQAVTRNILAWDDVPAAFSETLVGRIMQDGLAGWVSRERQAALVENTAEDPRWLTLPDQPYAVRSALVVPIEQGTLLLGILTLMHSEPGHYSTQDLRVMKAAMQQTALVVRNALIYEEQRRMADQQTTLYEVLRTLQHPQELRQMGQLSVETVAQLTGWGFVGLLARGEDGEILQFTATAGEVQLQPVCLLTTVAGPISEAWQSGRSRYIPDIHRIADTPCAVASVFLAPIKFQGQVQQLLYIASDKLDTFNTDDHLLAKSLADVLTLAFQNARLYTELQHNLRRTNSLYRLTRSLVVRQDLHKVLAAAANGAVEALQADRVLLITLDLEKRQVLDFLGAGPGQEHIVAVSFEELMAGLIGWAVRHKDPVLSPKRIPDPRESPAVRERRQATQVGAIVVVPLIFADIVYGTITALNRPEQRDFTSEDLLLLSSIAAQVAVTIRNLRLFESVAEEQRRLQALVQSTQDGVILIGMNLHILVINQQALTYLGMDGTPASWLNHPLWDAVPGLRSHAPMVAHSLIHEMRRVQRGDEPPGEGEYQVGNRALEWFNLLVMGEQNPLGRLVILRDVTAARMVEKLRDDLTHTMVHDLRNPLTGVSLSLELLLRYVAENKDLPEAYMRLLDIAKSSSRQMLELVNAILDISRLESGRMSLDSAPLELHALVQEVLTLQRPQAAEKRIVLVDTVPEIMVEADKGLLVRVLQNLVGNAVKFTPEAGTVTVSATVVRDMPGKLQVSVTDTGPGIPPELQGRLFQKFVTGDYEERGSGLGLTFCRMVIEAQGEKIWLSSPPDKGATFIFTLPLVFPAS